MKDKPENPQAFLIESSNSLNELESYGKAGMTIRTYIATQVLQGLCAGRSEHEAPGADAELAVELADYLLSALAERSKSNE